MKGRGFLAPVLIGAALGVLVLGLTLVGLQRARSGVPLLGHRAETGVLVALVLPDAAGDRAARLIVYYPADGGRPVVVDPLTRSIVPGTSANTLGEALTFGGGAALSRAYAQLAGVSPPSWVLLDAVGWDQLGRGGLSVNLPRPVDVFDGTELVSFPAGAVVVQPGDTGVLLAGIAGMEPSARADILGQVAASLQRSLASATVTKGLRSDLSATQIRTWLVSLGARSVPATSVP